jgi:hypothetical protein
MGSARPFGKERLVVGSLANEGAGETAVLELIAALEEGLGRVDWRGPELPFPWTDYYEVEMGPALRRSFLSFADLVDPGELASVKLFTNAVERRFSSGGRRRFNLDPGLLSLGRFVLATTKDRAHRIPLSTPSGEGIYGELTLIYEKGAFRPLPWTYPDWASEEYRNILAGLRERLKSELRQA